MSEVRGAFDVAVIGGGWGGLATAALLSRAGLSVLLAEARAVVGGRASFQEREGFLLDYGIHAHRFGGDGAAAGVYRKLGEPLELVEPGPGIIHHRGNAYPVPRKPLEFMTTKVLGGRAKRDTARALARIAGRRPGKYYRVPVAELVPRGIDEEARAMVSAISGLGLISPDLETTSAGELIWFLHRAARAGEMLSFPRGGCSQHVRRLVAIVERGGEVRTGCRVEMIRLSGGRASGIECKDGTVAARAVVAAFPLPSVAALLPEDTLGAALARRMAGIVPTAGLSWDVALSGEVAEEHAVISTDPLVVGAFTSNIDGGLCPPGHQLSTWCMPLPRKVLEAPEDIRRSEEELRRAVFRIFPAMEEKVLWERMLRLPVIDGAVPAASQPWTDRPAPGSSGVPGLFFAGDTVGVPGEGGDIAFASALECAGAVEGYLG